MSVLVAQSARPSGEEWTGLPWRWRRGQIVTLGKEKEEEEEREEEGIGGARMAEAKSCWCQS